MLAINMGNIRSLRFCDDMFTDAMILPVRQPDAGNGGHAMRREARNGTRFDL